MNCYVHGVAAVGICKSCQKGLCHACAVDLGKGLACISCEQDVRHINQIVARDKRLSPMIANNVRVSRLDTWVFLVIGALFTFGSVASTVFELSRPRPYFPSLVVHAGIFVFGVFMTVTGIRRRRVEPDPKMLEE